MPVPCLTAETRCPDPPEWARLQRQLLAEIEVAADAYLAKYARDDGTLIYADHWANGRDGLDDLYEAFYNLPLLYLLGGDAKNLDRAHHHWEAVNRQAAGYGLVKDEYELGYDQFHQSEGNQFFYLLCAADPENPKLIDRARRFANLYLGPPNYDPDANIIRAVHTGAGGPRWGYLEANHDMWTRFMEPFGLPYYDLPGIAGFDDVASWNTGARHDDNRRRMVDAMNTRMGQGDSVSNLLSTSLITHAFLMTGDAVYRDWVETYTRGWWDRAKENGGLIPDNVGLNGQVGANFDGDWFGAAYGWTWPLGYDYVGDAVSVAAMNATLLTGAADWATLPGALFDHVFANGRAVADYTAPNPPRPDPWVVHAAAAAGSNAAFVAPKKYRADGWFAEYPFIVGPLASLWCTNFSEDEAGRLAQLRAAEPQDWAASYAFRAKGDDGHERPWLEFLAGRYDTYPETILRQSLGQVAARSAQVRADTADLSRVHIHHWQNHNPITTEALVQLTLGAPQQRYNGGMFRAAFRYFDRDADRPGLPPDVGALVSGLSKDGAQVTFVNLRADATRRLRIIGGFYGEHRITNVSVDGQGRVPVDGGALCVDLPPATEIQLSVGLDRFANTPRLALGAEPALEAQS